MLQLGASECLYSVAVIIVKAKKIGPIFKEAIANNKIASASRTN